MGTTNSAEAPLFLTDTERDILACLARKLAAGIEVPYREGSVAEREVLKVFLDGVADRLLGSSVPGMTDIREVACGLHRKLEELRGTGKTLTGLPTGFSDLDAYSSGLHRGELILVAGRARNGTSALALNIVRALACESGVPTALFTLEAGHEQVALKLACMLSEVDILLALRGLLKDEEWERFVNQGLKRLREAPICLDEFKEVTSLANLRARARRMVARNQAEIIVIDEAQLLQTREDTWRRLAGLARELNVPVLATCRLPDVVEDSAEEVGPPGPADLRLPGAPDRHADLVLWLHRAGVYCDPPDFEAAHRVIITRNGHGPTGDFKLSFEARTLRFRSYVPEGLE